MTSVLDVWRFVDPESRLVSGSIDRLAHPVRGVVRTRATPPHLPPLGEGQLLVVDAAILDDAGLDGLARAIRAAELDPAAVWVVAPSPPRLEPAGDEVPILAGEGVPAEVARRAAAHLDREEEQLAGFAASLRLAAAEAALTDPTPAAPAGVGAARLRRGVATTVDGALAALVPRDAGRALATRFAAAHARLLAGRSGRTSTPRRTRDGLWILERPIGPSATAWLFDDLPLGRVDAVGLDALAVTLRALGRRQAVPAPRPVRRQPPSTGDPVRDTLLEVARANGRIAPAARRLGVHRNTVLYRLRRASAELGIDPRRPEDALRLLRDE